MRRCYGKFIPKTNHQFLKVNLEHNGAKRKSCWVYFEKNNY
jgi:hypothetical protein